MPSTAGKIALVKIGGTPTAFTDEAVAVLTTNKKYQISNAAKQIWSPTATITVKAAGIAVDPVADPYVINRLTGVVTFTNVSARGTVTVSGTYMPMTTIVKSKSITYDRMNEVLDDTTFDSAGYEENIPGIHSISASLGRNWETTYSTVFKNALLNGTLLVIQVFHDNGAAANIAFWARPTKQSISIATRNIIGEDLTFRGASDADLRTVSLI
jgi:hypothetical protein